MESPVSRDITRLPRPVHSRLRSAVIIPTFSQILNELVQNSLDAGATRIECWIGLERGNEMIRVEDDGHGLDRDGLNHIGRASGTSIFPGSTMLAERQRPARTVQMPNAGQLIPMASKEKVGNTMKHKLTAALASISSLGLLEISSKTARSRHTYTKVIKVSHLLHSTQKTDWEEWYTCIRWSIQSCNLRKSWDYNLRQGYLPQCKAAMFRPQLTVDPSEIRLAHLHSICCHHCSLQKGDRVASSRKAWYQVGLVGG